MSRSIEIELAPLDRVEPFVAVEDERAGRARADQHETRVDQASGADRRPWRTKRRATRTRARGSVRDYLPRSNPPKIPRRSWLPICRPTELAIERPADCIILSAMLGLAASRARRASSRSCGPLQPFGLALLLGLEPRLCAPGREPFPWRRWRPGGPSRRPPSRHRSGPWPPRPRRRPRRALALRISSADSRSSKVSYFGADRVGADDHLALFRSQRADAASTAA